VKRVVFILLASLIPLFSVFNSQLDAAAIYYILDASGSMWGRVNGQMKIDVAKDAMTKLINAMPEDLLSGVTVYGHRKKGDCSDIEELIPLGDIDRSEALERIRKIKPRGKTPIATTIERTVHTLWDIGQQRINIKESAPTIVLISDGIESCGGDPCAAALTLKSSGMKFVMHVVGFDVDKNASEKLACIAKACGGKYFGAPDSEELLAVLSAVQRSVVQKSALEDKGSDGASARQLITTEDSISKVALPDSADITQSISTESKSVRIKAKGPGKITFRHDSWLKKPYAWKLIDPETGEDAGKFSTLETTVVAPGDYQLVWDQYQHESSDVALTEVVRVEAGKTVEIPLLTAIQLKLPPWVDKPLYWGLRDPQTLETVVTFAKFEPFPVPAGEYYLIWRQGEHSAHEVAIQKVNIIPDRVNEVTVATAINPVPAAWLDKKIHYWGLKLTENPDVAKSASDPEGSDSRGLYSDPDSFIAWFSGSFAPQLVPPGKYCLIYDISEHGSSDSPLGEIEVAEGRMNDFHINTGIQLIPPEGVKPPYFVEFIELNRDPPFKVRLNGSFGPVALKPGKYRIDYRQEEHGSSTMTIVDELDLNAGNLVEIEL